MNFFIIYEYQIIRWLGRLNIVLAVIAVSLFVLRRVNRYFFSNRNAVLQKVIKPLNKIHPYIGMTLVVTALIHGILALGTLFRVHTGPLVWWILFLMMVVALVGKKYKIKKWLQVHRSLAILLVIAVLIHLSARNIF